MTPNTAFVTPTPDEREGDSAPRRPYTKPALQSLGTLEELTAFQSSGFVPDGDPTGNGFDPLS